MEYNTQTIITLAVGSLASYYIAKSFLTNEQRTFKTDSKPRIKKLIIYPIKSIQGIEVDHLDINEHGAKWNKFMDRALCLVNDKNVMLTLRNKPQLSLISSRFEGNSIILEASTMSEPLRIDYDADCRSNELITFEIWGQMSEGYDCGEHIQKWFTEYLGSPAKMVRFVDGLKTGHPVVLNQKLDQTSVYYQDGFPLMMMNQSSIDDLNQKMNGRHHVSWDNFRPNILVEDAEAFEEDHWKMLKMNQVTCHSPKPCDRCLLTTVQLTKGEKHPDMEPIRTLRTYRLDKQWNEKAPLFGINLIPQNYGTIRVGDQVQILQFQSDGYIHL